MFRRVTRKPITEPITAPKASAASTPTHQALPCGSGKPGTWVTSSDIVTPQTPAV